MLNSSDQTVWNTWVEHFFNEKNTIPIPKIYKSIIKTTLDLHGLTIQQAFLAVNQFLENHSLAGSKNITIITGKSGPIFKEFPSWIQTNSHVKNFQPIIDKRNQVGSFKVQLKMRNFFKSTP